MRVSKKIVGIVIFTGIVVFGGLNLGERLSISSVIPVIPGFVSTVQARVGRPLSPVSVAGVARRTGRRCATGVYNC